MGKGGATGLNGWYYSFGIHMGLSRGPIDELVEIKIGDKTAWQGSVKTSTRFRINAPDLFGGDKAEGGVVGDFDLMMGEPTQKAVSGLVGMLGHALPGFRGMCTAFFNGRICANNPYPKKWMFRERRALKGWDGDAPWYPEKCRIVLHGDPVFDDDGVPTGEDTEIHAMNPAHIIWELYTNREWGRGLPVSALDQASFIAAADKLFEEGFGLCLRWTRRDSLESFIQSVLDHISATVYSDRQTALLTLKLIRNDYTAASLPVYDTDSGILEIQEAEVSALGPGVNEIVVEYTDPVSNLTRTVSNQNLASLQATRGVFNSLKKQYPGLPTSALALRVAQRDLRTNAMALRRFKITFDRRAWRIPPAGVIRIRDLNRGIADLVVRVGRVEDGTLQNGTITITAVQDVFGLPLASFIGNEPPNWVKPNNKPVLKRHRAFEVPYFLLNASMTPADFAYIKEDGAYLGTVVEKPSNLSLAYNLYVRPDAPAPEDNP